MNERERKKTGLDGERKTCGVMEAGEPASGGRSPAGGCRHQ